MRAAFPRVIETRLIGVARFASLALIGELRNSDKEIPHPKVIYVESEEWNGMYLAPDRAEVYIGSRPMDLSRGALLVSTNLGFDGYGSVLAHEWRHHWQTENGWKYDGIELDALKSNYYSGIRQYFKQSRSEMDALLYEWMITGKPFEPWEWAIRSE